MPNNILVKITLCICKVKKNNLEAKKVLYPKNTFYVWLNINLASLPTSLSKIYFSVDNFEFRLRQFVELYPESSKHKESCSFCWHNTDYTFKINVGGKAPVSN